MALQRHSGLLVPREELLPQSACCSVCRGAQMRKVFPAQDDPPVWFRRCATCAVVSADRMPNGDLLNRYYREYYGDSPLGGREQQVTVSAIRRLAGHIVTVAVPRSLAKGYFRILDFGGGDGAVSLAVADHVRRRGAEHVEITVVDPSNSSIEENGPIRRKAFLSDEDAEAFDLVIASAVIEHVADPGRTLRVLFDCLAPGAAFYARTPYHEAMAQLAGRFGRHLDLGYPAHLHDMGAHFWDGILHHLGLADEDLVVTRSSPSVVASSWSSRFWKTLAAYCLKAPWWLLGHRWRFVGGWEAVISRPTPGPSSASTAER